MAKFIPLSQNKWAFVDDDDYEELSKYKWHYSRNGNGDEGYAVRGVYENGKCIKKIRMHREIMNYEGGLIVDHINGKRLDNRKINLRICTSSENSLNTRIHRILIDNI